MSNPTPSQFRRIWSVIRSLDAALILREWWFVMAAPVLAGIAWLLAYLEEQPLSIQFVLAVFIFFVVLALGAVVVRYWQGPAKWNTSVSDDTEGENTIDAAQPEHHALLLNLVAPMPPKYGRIADFVIQIERFYAGVSDLCGKGTLNSQAVIDQMKVGFAPRVKSLLGSSVHAKYLDIIGKDEDKPLFAMFAGIAYLRDTMYTRLISAISKHYETTQANGGHDNISVD